MTKLNEIQSIETKRYLKILEQLLRDANFPSMKIEIRPKHPGFRFNVFNLMNMNGSSGYLRMHDDHGTGAYLHVLPCIVC